MNKTALFAWLSVFILFGLFYSSSAHAIDHQLSLTCPFIISAHVRELIPAGEIKGDVLYVHGLGDNSRNHDPLLNSWLEHGYRVIAIDLPSHGETSGRSLNWCNFKNLGQYILEIDRRLKPADGSKRKLLISGWSTGALILLRMVQNKQFKEHFRKPVAMQLWPPAISPRLKVGNWWGRITEPTLTRNPVPPHHGEITPRSPYFVPLFAGRMLFESFLARWDDLPLDLPTQIFLAGDHSDRYVRNASARRWCERQIGSGRPLWVMQFEGAFHELDNEPNGVGYLARQHSLSFSRYALEGIPLPNDLRPGYSQIYESN